MALDVMKILQTKFRTPAEFNYDMMQARPLYSYLTPVDIEELHKIATSIRLASKIKIKYQKIDEIMRMRGFRRFAGGTNRIVYACYDDPSILIKVAVDRVGINDNPDEFRIQEVLKPYCSKMFEVSRCGTVGLCERVIPVGSVEEFRSIAEDVYAIIVNKIIGKYVIDDIGTDYFLNYGVRPGFGPVLVDYPYVYELDGAKLFCNREYPDKSICRGEIDYDAGFNHLYCQKCGKKFKAIDLKSNIDNKKVCLTNFKGGLPVKVTLTKNGVTRVFGSTDESVMRRQIEKDKRRSEIELDANGAQVVHFRKKEVVKKEEAENLNTNIPEGFELDEEDDIEIIVEENTTENDITPILDKNTATEPSDKSNDLGDDINKAHEAFIKNHEDEEDEPSDSGIVTRSPNYNLYSTSVRKSQTINASERKPAARLSIMLEN